MLLRLLGIGIAALSVVPGAPNAPSRARIAGGTQALASIAGISPKVRNSEFLEALSRANIYRNWNLLPDDQWRENILGHLRSAAKNGSGEWVPSVLDESLWLREAGNRSSGGTGLAGLLAWDLRAAQAYAGLASAGPGVAVALAETAGLRKLVGRYAELLYLYGPALALTEQGAQTPGGSENQKVWTDLVGESPRNAGRFLIALMERDDGRMLAWFAFLQELPARHQKLYVTGLTRAKTFYSFFRDSPDLDRGAKRRIVYSTTTDYLRGIPVNEEGLVLLPGGLSAWQGTGKGGRQESLDQILLRVGREREMPRPGDGWAWRRIEAVAAVEASRGKTLTAAEARMLAEEYQSHPGLFGYFVSLHSMGEAEWRSIFRLADKAEGLDASDRNRLMGHFHSVAKLASLLVHAEAVDEAQASAVVGRLSWDLSEGKTEGEWAQSSARALKTLCGNTPVEEFVEAALCGCERRKREFREVLALQRIPPVDASLELVQAAGGLKPSGEGWEAVSATVKLIPELPPSSPDGSDVAKVTRSDAAARARDTARRIQEAAGSSAGRADISKLKAEMEERAGDVLLLSTTGLVYAWYLRPHDLLASEDPWFTRKHRYVNVRGRNDEPGDFSPGYFRMQSGGIGSFAGGSLANFSEAAGQVAAVGSIPDTRAVESLQFTQLGVLRGTMMGKLKAEDFRAAHSMVQSGRAWIEEAARGRVSESDMWTMTAGLLTPGRWQQVLAEARAGRWENVRRKITLSDLYWLGERRQKRSGGDPARHLRHSLGNPGMQPVPGDGPPMMEPWPYESMYRKSLAGECAVRMAELALALAVVAGREGLTPEEVEAGAEKLASRLIESLQMVDGTDWEAVNAAWASINAESVRAAAREGLRQ